MFDPHPPDANEFVFAIAILFLTIAVLIIQLTQ
jgi:hypothetical protein